MVCGIGRLWNPCDCRGAGWTRGPRRRAPFIGPFLRNDVSPSNQLTPSAVGNPARTPDRPANQWAAWHTLDVPPLFHVKCKLLQVAQMCLRSRASSPCPTSTEYPTYHLGSLSACGLRISWYDTTSLLPWRCDAVRNMRPTCVGRRCSLEWPYPHLYFGIPIYIFAAESPSVPAASLRGSQVPPLLNSLTSGGHALRADPHSRKRIIKSHLSPPLAPFGANEAPISRYLLVVEARILKWRRWVIT